MLQRLGSSGGVEEEIEQEVFLAKMGAASVGFKKKKSFLPISHVETSLFMMRCSDVMTTVQCNFRFLNVSFSSKVVVLQDYIMGK